MEELYYPNYDKAIFRVTPTILAENFGIELGEYEKSVFKNRKIRQYFGESDIAIVTIFDALAPSTLTGKLYELWRKNSEIELSSIFPTLTAPAILSIYTGLPPELSGITSTKVYIREIGNYIDALKGKTVSSDIPLAKAGVDIESFLWRKPVISLLNEDIIACDLLPFGIIGGLRDFYGKYLQPIGYDGSLDAIYLIDKLIDYISTKKKKGLIFLYFSTTDSFGHDHGINIAGWNEINERAMAVANKIIEITKNKNKKISTYFISDHGFIQIKRWLTIDENMIDRISREGVKFIGKSGRFMSLYIDSNEDTETKIENIQTIFGDLCQVLDIQKYSKQFWPWLEEEEKFYERTGDILVIPKHSVDFYKIRNAMTEEKPITEFIRTRQMLKANHGGPTKEELSALFMGYTNK